MMAGLRRAEALTVTNSFEPWSLSGCVRVLPATATQAGTLVIRRGQLNRTFPHCQADLPWRPSSVGRPNLIGVGCHHPITAGSGDRKHFSGSGRERENLLDMF